MGNICVRGPIKRVTAASRRRAFLASISVAKGLTPNSDALERLPILLQNLALYRSNEQEAGWILVEGKELMAGLILAAYEDAVENTGKPLTEKEIESLLYRERQTIAEKLGIQPYKLDRFFDANSLRDKLKKRRTAAEGKAREAQRKRVAAKYPEYPDILKQMKAARAEWRERDKEIKGGQAFSVIGGIARIGTPEQRRYTNLGKKRKGWRRTYLGRFSLSLGFTHNGKEYPGDQHNDAWCAA